MFIRFGRGYGNVYYYTGKVSETGRKALTRVDLFMGRSGRGPNWRATIARPVINYTTGVRTVLSGTNTITWLGQKVWQAPLLVCGFYVPMPSHRTGSGWDQRNMRERACTAWPRTRRPSSRLSLVPLSRRRSKAAQHTSALLPSSQCPVVLAEAGSVPTQLKLREMRCGQDSGRARSVPVVNEDFILLVRTYVLYVL